MSERALAKVKILLRSSPIKSGSKSTETVALAAEVAQVCCWLLIFVTLPAADAGIGGISEVR